MFLSMPCVRFLRIANCGLLRTEGANVEEALGIPHLSGEFADLQRFRFSWTSTRRRVNGTSNWHYLENPFWPT